MPNVHCKICTSIFYAKPSARLNGWGKYCSLSCARIGKKTGIYKKCSTCGIKTYKSGKALNGSKSGKFFCGKSCQTRWRNSEVFSGKKHSNWKGGASVAYRDILSKNNIPKICIYCKMTDARVLVAHHIDKNRKNNTLKNLIWLCCNCHFLIHHHKKEEEKLKTYLKSQ